MYGWLNEVTFLKLQTRKEEKINEIIYCKHIQLA